MKKTYIEPKNTVVKLSLERMIAGSADPNQLFGGGNADVVAGSVEMESREVIETPDAWDEW